MVIGAMKGATTWIYENLRCHPDIFLPDAKEDYFFSHHFYQRTFVSYARRFAPGRGRLKGEITPGYGILPRARIRLIHAINPSMKLVFVARNPLERSWSEALMNLVDKRHRALADVTEQEFADYCRFGPCRARSDYISILQSWLSVFPREQLFLGLYEQVSDDPQRLLQDMLQFLGVCTEVDWQALPLSCVVVPKYEDHGGVARGIIAQGRQASSRPISGSLREMLRDDYSPMVRRLIEEYQLPVEHWLEEAGES
jgi:hypothetical protein